MTDIIKEFPAPWDLKGHGYIFLYKFSRKFVEEKGNVPEFLKGSFSGGFGSVMLVNYESSNAGPYDEFLFIPGKFKYNGKRLDTISKIYVSSLESVYNGRKNWGIPKEYAEFKFKKINEKEEKITIEKDEIKLASFVIDSSSIGFPVNTNLLPFPLVQKYEDQILYTSFHGKGKGHFSKVKEITINSDLFPDISDIKPIAVIKVDPFSITFPIAEKEE